MSKTFLVSLYVSSQVEPSSVNKYKYIMRGAINTKGRINNHMREKTNRIWGGGNVRVQAHPITSTLTPTFPSMSYMFFPSRYY